MSETLMKDKTKIDSTLGRSHSVVLFNDDVHSFDQVINQIVKAIKCNAAHASSIAMQAHSKGQAIVFTGNLERCEHVDSILAGPPANLRTKIEEA